MIAAETAENKIICKLLDDGVVTSAGIDSLRREAELLGLPLIEILQHKDLVSESDVGQAYAELSGLRFLDLSRRSPSGARGDEEKSQLEDAQRHGARVSARVVDTPASLDRYAAPFSTDFAPFLKHRLTCVRTVSPNSRRRRRTRSSSSRRLAASPSPVPRP